TVELFPSLPARALPALRDRVADEQDACVGVVLDALVQEGRPVFPPLIPTRSGLHGRVLGRSGLDKQEAGDDSGEEAGPMAGSSNGAHGPRRSWIDRKEQAAGLV